MLTTNEADWLRRYEQDAWRREQDEAHAKELRAKRDNGESMKAFVGREFAK